MQVKALFFAAYRDIVGVGELKLELPDGSSVADLAHLMEARTGISDLPLVVAVNRRYVPPETQLSDGDEVAFIPPVAGG